MNVFQRLGRRRLRALPWLALGVLALVPLKIAYGSYSTERSAFNSGPKQAPPDPASLGVPGLRAVSFGKAGGPKLYGVYVEPKNGACVVLAHGSSSDHTALMPEAQFLSAAGFGVLALDFPGHGQSEGKITWDESERLALGAALDFAATQPNVDATKLGLFGFSMGGYIATQVAATDPRVRAVVIASAPADAREHTLHEYKKWGALSQWPALLALRVSGMQLDKLVPREVISRIAPRQLLLVAGDKDEHVPPSMAQQLFDAAKEPKRLLLVPGAGHGGYREASPVDYPKAVLSFFGQALL